MFLIAGEVHQRAGAAEISLRVVVPESFHFLFLAADEVGRGVVLCEFGKDFHARLAFGFHQGGMSQ